MQSNVGGKDGSERSVHITDAPVCNEDGEEASSRPELDVSCILRSWNTYKPCVTFYCLLITADLISLHFFNVNASD